MNQAVFLNILKPKGVHDVRMRAVGGVSVCQLLLVPSTTHLSFRSSWFEKKSYYLQIHSASRDLKRLATFRLPALQPPAA